MTTVKIKPSHPSQGEFVVIDKKDFDPAKHELLDGESLGSDAGAAGEHAPTPAELLAGRDQLQARKDQLDDLELMLNQRASEQAEREQALAVRETAVVEREQANEAEAKRLLAEAASLQAAKDAAAAPASTDKPAKAGKAT